MLLNMFVTLSDIPWMVNDWKSDLYIADIFVVKLSNVKACAMLLYAYNILCEMEATENDEYTLSYKVDSLTVDSKETIDWYELWYMVAILVATEEKDINKLATLSYNWAPVVFIPVATLLKENEENDVFKYVAIFWIIELNWKDWVICFKNDDNLVDIVLIWRVWNVCLDIIKNLDTNEFSWKNWDKDFEIDINFVVIVFKLKNWITAFNNDKIFVVNELSCRFCGIFLIKDDILIAIEFKEKLCWSDFITVMYLSIIEDRLKDEIMFL